MAGHNKWSKIKRKKGANDARRSQIFTKIIKEITVAARLGGPDPDGNARLYLAIQAAKAANMPKDNVERAIAKATSADAENLEEPVYEGYGPAKVAIIVECATDNTNRSVRNVRAYFNKVGGSLVTSGTFDFIFDTKGVYSFRKPVHIAHEELMLELIDAGAEEVDTDEDGTMTLTTSREDFGAMQQKLRELNLEIESARLERVPNILKRVEEEDFKQVMKLIDFLEEDDDVQQVYHNMEITDELMEAYEG